MKLNFHGGVNMGFRTRLAKSKIKEISRCSAVCLKAEPNANTLIPSGSPVFRGSLLGRNGETPVYSSVAGIFRGIMDIENRLYFVVTANEEADNRIHTDFMPETRAITDLSCADIISAAKQYAIIDSRSGIPLWQLLEKADGKCRRVVVDCTEPDASSAIAFRLCLEKAHDIVNGAKIALHAVGALKCVFAAEHYREAVFEALGKYAIDDKLFAMAELDEKYPHSDRTIMDALYVETLSHGETAPDKGVLIIGAETALALFNCMANGVPQLDRYISVCGNGVVYGGNYQVPRGITLHDLQAVFGGNAPDHILVENTLLSGRQASGALSDKTRAIIGVKPQKHKQTGCISCGNCVDACAERLSPYEILSKNSKQLTQYCVFCGACEFVCPAHIPLMKLIAKRKEASKNEQ